LKSPTSRKRILLWDELDEELQSKAVLKLRRLAKCKVEYDGTLLPYAWADRVAPLLRYTLTSTGEDIWDCDPTPKDRKRGCTLFSLPILSLDDLARKEAA
jgi:hypothetical protein